LPRRENETTAFWLLTVRFWRFLKESRTPFLKSLPAAGRCAIRERKVFFQSSFETLDKGELDDHLWIAKRRAFISLLRKKGVDG
jgi:hypothetical protein